MTKTIQDLLVESNALFRESSKNTKILASLSWDPSIAEEFFNKKELEPPVPTYKIDSEFYNNQIQILLQHERKLKGDDPVLDYLRKTSKSIRQGMELLLNLETPKFFEISRELYGNAESHPYHGEASNLEMAQWIKNRISARLPEESQDTKPTLTSEQFAERIEEWLKKRRPFLDVKVELSENIASRVVAGVSRIRIRKNSFFSSLDLTSLWNHEIQSHCLTAQNGLEQKNFDFLFSGGPRTTMTQEGLAVFYELFDHSISQNRFLALCDRIEAVHMVEKGADFLTLYRWYKDRSQNPREAFYSTQRIFRGAMISGGAPFTKDIVYLAGLFGVYNFLKIAVKNQNHLLVESLIAGRIALEDVGVIASLRKSGFLSPPKYLPPWLHRWEALLSHFTFASLITTSETSYLENYFKNVLKNQGWDIG